MSLDVRRVDSVAVDHQREVIEVVFLVAEADVGAKQTVLTVSVGAVADAYEEWLDATEQLINAGEIAIRNPPRTRRARPQGDKE